MTDSLVSVSRDGGQLLVASPSQVPHLISFRRRVLKFFRFRWTEKLKILSRHYVVFVSILLVFAGILFRSILSKRFGRRGEGKRCRVEEGNLDCSEKNDTLQNSTSAIDIQNKITDQRSPKSAEHVAVHPKKEYFSVGEGTPVKHKKRRTPLILLLGIPGCGKSTWAAKYKAKVHKNATIVSSDDIRLELRGSVKDRSREEEVRKIILERVREAVSQNEPVIIDDCVHNLDAAFRKEVLTIVENSKYETTVQKLGIKPVYAEVQIQNDVAKGIERYIPSFPELEKIYDQYLVAVEALEIEGWGKIKH